MVGEGSSEDLIGGLWVGTASESFFVVVTCNALIVAACKSLCLNSNNTPIVLSRPRSAWSASSMKSVTSSSNAALRNFSSKLPCSWMVICCSAMTAIWSPVSNCRPNRCIPRRFSFSISSGADSILSSSRRGGGGARLAARLILIRSKMALPSW